MRPPKQISYDETTVDSSDYLQDIKKEPLDIPYEEATSYGVKNEHLEYQNEVDFNLNDTLQASSNIWELLVKRCRFLIQEDHGLFEMNSHLLTQILVKEVNELLSNVVTFFQDCCVSVEENENYVLEVDGLLVNCLPCHPQNTSCYYRIAGDIPQSYLDTLFCPLDNQIENNYYDEENQLPLAPEVEIDIKKEVKDVKKVKKIKRVKKTKDVTEKPKTLKSKPICELCGKEFSKTGTLKEHVRSVHEKKKAYECKKCGDTFRSRAGLNHHRKREGKNKCPGQPRNTRKLIHFGEDIRNPKCLHPDCVDKNLPRFTFAGIMNHIIDLHSPDPDDSVSFF